MITPFLAKTYFSLEWLLIYKADKKSKYIFEFWKHTFFSFKMVKKQFFHFLFLFYSHGRPRSKPYFVALINNYQFSLCFYFIYLFMYLFLQIVAM